MNMTKSGAVDEGRQISYPDLVALWERLSRPHGVIPAAEKPDIHRPTESIKKLLTQKCHAVVERAPGAPILFQYSYEGNEHQQ